MANASIFSAEWFDNLERLPLEEYASYLRTSCELLWWFFFLWERNMIRLQDVLCARLHKMVLCFAKAVSVIVGDVIKNLFGLKWSVMWLRHLLVLKWCGVNVVRTPFGVADDVMRDRVEIEDRLTGAELVIFLKAAIWDWCLAHVGGPVEDGLIFFICRDARSALGGPFWGWPEHINVTHGTAVQWTLEVQDESNLNYVYTYVYN